MLIIQNHRFSVIFLKHCSMILLMPIRGISDTVFILFNDPLETSTLKSPMFSIGPQKGVRLIRPIKILSTSPIPL